ncbi:hypothetical protein JTB14_014673 [Gonioctena quinquepunctata]|nr:hypothetical protein JTB14_014673 [Gonioctena quinquepunctata]
MVRLGHSQQVNKKPSVGVETFDSNSTSCSKDRFTDTIMTCSEFVFETTERTIVNDWNLTCLDNQWKLSLVGTSHFAGIILGTVTCGILADKFGRKTIFTIYVVLMGLLGVIQVISPEYITFVVFTFLYSLVTAAVYPLVFILSIEMVGKKKRELTAVAVNYFYSIGEALVAPIAYYTQDWVQIQLIVSLPALIFVGYYWAIPESVRWLLANKRKEEAREILFTAAKINKVTLSQSALAFLNDDSSNNYDDSGGDTMFSVFKEMVSSKKLVMRFLIMYFIWGVNAFIYYGLSINSTSLGGNKYLNFAMVALVEIPGVTIPLITMKTLGRRISLAGSLLLCGVTCILTIFVSGSESNWAVILFFLMGKIGVTSAFAIVFVYTAEMFPTILRSGGVGSASTIARFGALFAPFAPMLGLFFAELPMIVFGCAAILAGLLALKLPETLGKRLPETVEEAKAI